ncbi:hypothetical protein C5167_048582 [Papaver somniferum]|uniref:Expansin n=1 Tax=Papaver somniferum TaxID=3469 RepID=A0A4Y7KLQ9_PAPSO|nr:putative expansin-A30 [Papaver somniferum]RZC73101.1 hypothetical protein C5167_048582 [Papaver somniferum]
MAFSFAFHTRNLINFLSIIIVFSLMTMESTVTLAASYGSVAHFRPTTWKHAHVTYYGDGTASGTMGGACGFENLFNSGYGSNTAALSPVLFNNGFACGTCYQIKCINSKWCYKDTPYITVTGTDRGPPSWASASDNGAHFDLNKPAFMKFAQLTGGILPVIYRRVPCMKRGGIRFKLQGNGYWLLVFVMNVGGGGDISKMWVRRSRSGRWMSMTHNWGVSHQAFAELGGQSLSFRLQSYSTKKIITASYVTPSNWNTGMTYKSSINFR